MTLNEYIRKLEAVQDAVPELMATAARNATLRAIEAAQDKTPPTADSLGGTNTRTGELKQHWATDSKTEPDVQNGQYVTELNNNKEYASYVNDGHRMNRHFVPGLYVNETSGLLEYDPGRREEVGMMVGTKTKYVEGVYMAEAGMRAYEETADEELKKASDIIGRMLE